MSVNPEVDGIVALAAPAPAEPSNGHQVVIAVPQPQPGPAAAEAEKPAVPRERAQRRRPAWLASTSVGVVALIAAGTLGYLQITTTQERNATQRGLAATQATLAAAQADAAARAVTAKYVALYVRDEGKVQSDYSNFLNCNSFGSCRTTSQELLTDLQAFQADRRAANLPLALAGDDSTLGDALSAAIAAGQEIINAMDNDNLAKFKDGVNKLNTAMLSVAKVELNIGNELS
jgi:hypothetical protein